MLVEDWLFIKSLALRKIWINLIYFYLVSFQYLIRNPVRARHAFFDLNFKEMNSGNTFYFEEPLLLPIILKLFNTWATPSKSSMTSTMSG